MSSIKKQAHLAGVLYLLVIVFGVFAELFVRKKLIIPGNPGQSVQQILANQALFRVGFISDLLMQLSFFFLALALFRLLEKVNQSYASFMVLCVAIGVAIMCLNMLNQYAVILILEKSNFMEVFEPSQTEALIALFMELQRNGYRIAQVFFGLWLLPLGYLSYHSGFIPKIIGILLIIACFSFLLDFLLFFGISDYPAKLSSIVTFPTTIAEFAMCFWLLIVGK